MAFGNSSGIFKNYVWDALGPTASFTPHMGTGGTWKVALYGNTGTPDNKVTSASSAYNATGSAWVTANEVTDTNWPAGGRPLVYSGGSGATGTRWATPSTGDSLFTFDADDTTGAGNVTVSNVYGDLVYDTGSGTVANQGMAFHAFGGAKSVTGGTFTIVWNASGIAQWTHSMA